MPKNVQIRDLDDEVYAVLRSRACAEDLSLAQYLRRELTGLAGTPSMAEWLDGIHARRRDHDGVGREALDDAVAGMRADREARADLP